MSDYANDSNNDPRTYAAAGLPPGLIIDPPTAVRSSVVVPWDAEFGPVGPHVIISAGIPEVIRRLGDLICWPIEEVAGGGPLTFAATLPPGLSFDASTGLTAGGIGPGPCPPAPPPPS
jgi:hypothetical protein